MVVYILSALFIPLPVLYYRMKFGRKSGALMLLAFAAVSMAVFDEALHAAFFLKFFVIGFAVGEFLDKNVSVEKTVAGACCLSIMIIAAGAMLYSSAVDADILKTVSDGLKKTVENNTGVFKELGWIREEHLPRLKALLYYVMARIVPAFVAGQMLFETWLCLMFSKHMFKAKNLPYPDFGDLALWRAPDYLVWFAIGFGFTLFLQNKLLLALGLSGLIIIFRIYFFQGIAVVSHYLGKKAMSNAARLALLGLIVIADIMHVVVAGIGFFDIWINSRKLGVANNENNTNV